MPGRAQQSRGHAIADALCPIRRQVQDEDRDEAAVASGDDRGLDGCGSGAFRYEASAPRRRHSVFGTALLIDDTRFAAPGFGVDTGGQACGCLRQPPVVAGGAKDSHASLWDTRSRELSQSQFPHIGSYRALDSPDTTPGGQSSA